MEETTSARAPHRRLRQREPRQETTKMPDVISLDSSSDEFVPSSGHESGDSEEEFSMVTKQEAASAPTSTSQGKTRGFKRLRPGGGESKSIPASVQPPHEDKESEWECTKCTFLNPPPLLACELCLSMRSVKRQSTRKIGSWLVAASTMKSSATKSISKPQIETIDSSDEGEPAPITRGRERRSAKLPDPSDTTLWAETSDAQSMDELCVQKKKVQEVQEWLLAASSRSQARLLFLCGPPGSGKSTTVRHLADRMGIAVKEWQDNSAAGRLQYNRLLRDDYQVSHQSAWDDFADFISVSMNYKSLTVEKAPVRQPCTKRPDQQTRRAMNTSDQLVLLESWPQNPLSGPDSQWDEKLKQAFRQIVNPASNLQYPVVCIFSDVRDKKIDTNQLAKTFSDEVMRSPFTSVINFNPITSAQVKKTVQRLLEKQNASLPSVDLAKIVDQCNGDIRHAINMAQLVLKRRQRQPKKQHTKTLSALSTGTSSQSVGPLDDDEPEESRDAFFSDFHIVGKLLHSKNVDASGVTQDDDRVFDSSAMSLDRVLSLLHTNSPGYFTEIEELDRAIELMSLTEDALHASYKLASGSATFKTAHDIAQALIVRTVLLSNEHPAPSAFRPIVAPRAYETARRMEAFRREALSEHRGALQDPTASFNYVCRGDVYTFEVQPLTDLIRQRRPIHHQNQTEVEESRRVLAEDDIEDTDTDAW